MAKILETLLDMSRAERLASVCCESGFTQVEVTGRSGDGGIDGKGIMRLGLLSSRLSSSANGIEAGQRRQNA